MILSLSVLLVILRYFWIYKGRDNVNFDITRGIRCYSCKSELRTRDDYFMNKIMNNSWDISDDKPIKCKVCIRDEKIKSITNKKILNLTYKLDKFIISDKFKKFQYFFLSSIIISLFIDIFLTFSYDIKYFSVITNSSNIIYWLLVTRRLKITTIKKLD